jgi:hypothetical protein
MDTDTETVQEQEVQEVAAPMEEAMESVEQPQEEVQEERREEQVPLSALQKERKKRQEAEGRAEERAKLLEGIYAKQLQSEAPSQDEDDQYEAVTKAEYKNGQQKVTQQVLETLWVRENPERFNEVKDNLKEFLNQRPHLKLAIEAAPNRYEEAYMLMNALSPKQKQALKVPVAVKKTAPGSPNAVPKAAGMNQAVDVMSMTDSEFSAWRKAQRKGR